MAVSAAQGFYSPSDGIVELNPTNFDALVTGSAEVWVVEFYAPWYVLFASWATELGSVLSQDGFALCSGVAIVRPWSPSTRSWQRLLRG